MAENFNNEQCALDEFRKIGPLTPKWHESLVAVWSATRAERAAIESRWWSCIVIDFRECWNVADGFDREFMNNMMTFRRYTVHGEEQYHLNVLKSPSGVRARPNRRQADRQ